MTVIGPTSPPPDGAGLDAPAADDPLAPASVESATGPVSATVLNNPMPAKRGGMFRSSAIYSGLTMVSRFMGFLRDLVVSARIGASARRRRATPTTP